MDKKAWPWKKKTPDKASQQPSDPPSVDAAALHTSASQAEEHSEASENSGKITSSMSGPLPMITGGDITSAPMAAAEPDAKDELVKQHMKIAEDAIAGWEKAEAEAADLKEKLEAALGQKLATEDRVSHLDGALKECMKQLRHVREEQELRIHEAVVKKTREWEKVRADMEARLEDATSELCAALAENQAMSKSLQERAKAMMELADARSRLEADNSRLQASLGTMEKENARLKHELHVLAKEIDHITDERESRKKAAEFASKQNVENAKKVAKLEEECQRLRLLLKKRGPNGVSVKSPGELPARRQSPCRRNSMSPSTQSGGVSVADYDLQQDGGLREENRALTDRIICLQEEAKSLRDHLAKKDQELQSARMMCAKTACKLSIAEEQLETRSFSCSSIKSASTYLPLQPSHGSGIVSVPVDFIKTDDVVCAESWATALIAELEQFKQEEKGSAPARLSSLNLMDDFAEMEKLASLSSPHAIESPHVKEAEKQHVRRQASTDDSVDCQEKQVDTEVHGQMTDGQIPAPTEELCRNLRERLAEAEARVTDLLAKQAASDSTIRELESLVAMKFGVEEGDGTLLSKAVNAARLAKEQEKVAGSNHEDVESQTAAANEEPGSRNGDIEADNNEENGLQGHIAANEDGKLSVWPADFISQADENENGAASGSDFSNVGAELSAAVRKFLDIVEGIGQTDYTFPYSQWISSSGLESDEDGAFDSPRKQWRSSGLDACVESLINLCNSLVQRKVDVIDFIAEVASALDWLVGLIFTSPEKSPSRNSRSPHGQADPRKEQPRDSCCDSELTSSAASSPAQLMRNATTDREETKTMESQDVLPDHCSISNLSFQYSESSTQEEDLSKISSAEHASLKLSLEAEARKVTRYESEILHLKLINEQREQNHELAMEKVQELESRVQDAEQMVQRLTMELQQSEKHSAELESQLSETLQSKISMEATLEELKCARTIADSELSNAKETIDTLQRQVATLEKELSESKAQYMELKWENESYKRETVQRSDSGSSADDDASRLKKEQELAAAAEKLAECQQTILDLGKQLKALGVSKNILEHPSPVLGHKNAISVSDHDGLDERDHSDELTTNERAQKQGRRTMKPLKATHYAGQPDGDPVTPGGRKGGGQASGKLGRQAQAFDMYSSGHWGFNRFPSPTHGDAQDGGGQQSIVEPVMTSPMRSPARFLSLRSKNVNSHDHSKHGENENGEKHASSGFSRFFGRTKGGIK